jgi:BASS family bile acid:Na+ symporter
MVTEFETKLLGFMMMIIMLGMGASLTWRDFLIAFRKPKGVLVGLLCQYGIMPLLGFLLAQALGLPPAIAVGLILIACMPGGTTSNIFTYFSKGNLALSVVMTTNATLWALIMTPLALVFYGGLLTADNPEFEIPIRNIVLTLVILLIPVVLGMTIRKFSANIGAILELMGGFFGLFFIVFLMATWVPRNWNLLSSTPWQVYVVAIGLGLFGITIAYFLTRLIRLHPANARTIALETGIQNGPLAIAIITVTFANDPNIGQIMLVPAMYSLFIVIISTIVTFWFRRANLAAEQKIPNLL